MLVCAAMFERAFAFDNYLATWDTSRVTTMYKMFAYTSFNHPVGDWVTSEVTNLRGACVLTMEKCKA